MKLNKKIIERHIPCPSCPSSDAYCIYEDGHGYCYSCKYLYLPNRPFEDKEKDILNEEFTYEYLSHRGISKHVFEQYGVRTKINSEGKPIALGFPYANGSLKIRLLDNKEFYTEGDIAKAGLFGRDKFAAGGFKTVTITEGELDALSLHEVVGGAVVSVQSAVTAVRDCTADRSWLNQFEKVYLAFDGDHQGREATRAVARLFDYDKVYDVKFSNRKDANEYLLAGEAQELRNLWWNAKKYLPETLRSSLSDFKNIIKVPLKRGIPYPFPTLTHMTYGIRTGETVLLTAQEKVGKTELMHAIEYQILKETEDNVGAIFLEEPVQRHLLALAGLELKAPIHLPDHGFTDDQIYSALETVVGKDERLYVYTSFGSDDPDVFLDTIRFLVTARNCRYILFDHISMAISGRTEVDERRALDYFSTKLEMMVKELDFALIMVSHVNDEGKTRGSRYLTKVADITINAHRDLMSVDPIVRNTVHLSVPYNRYCGLTGSAGSLLYTSSTCTFTEFTDAGGLPGPTVH